MSEVRQLAPSDSQSDFDAEKVTRLKADVESKALKFDSAKVAERMVAALG
jgi:anti-sigma28 factor (negative regulator of flagellin synthesis)